MDSPRRFIVYVIDPQRPRTAVPHLKTPHISRKDTASLSAPGKIQLDMAHELIAALHRAYDSQQLFVELPFMNDLISCFHVQLARPLCPCLETRDLLVIITSSLSVGLKLMYSDAVSPE